MHAIVGMLKLMTSYEERRRTIKQFSAKFSVNVQPCYSVSDSIFCFLRKIGEQHNPRFIHQTIPLDLERNYIYTVAMSIRYSRVVVVSYYSSVHVLNNLI